METVVPFRAWRYSPAAGDLSRLVAPPYDVIDQEMQSRLYARDRHNVVRVDLGITTPSDNECDDQYTRAAVQLDDWKRSGVLVRDARPSVTFVEESFVGPDGLASVRHGFLALMRLRDFDEGVVYPHEYTFAGPKEDRFHLMTATQMNLSPVFFLYDLPGDEITESWRSELGDSEPASIVRDELGALTKLWPTTEPILLGTVERSLVAVRFVIADGHHRYETALRYRDERRAQEAKQKAGGGWSGGDPRKARAYEYALAYFANAGDPGVAIYATHRLIAGLEAEKVTALPRSLRQTFAVERLTESPGDRRGVGGEADATSAQAAIAVYLRAHPRAAFGLWGPDLDGAYGLALTDWDAARTTAPHFSASYQELDVHILHSLVLERLLGISDGRPCAEARVAYFKDPGDAFARLVAGEFQVGFFMNPTGLDQVRRVALAGERMPQKATFFYPKLPTGLVFHDLSGSI